MWRSLALSIATVWLGACSDGSDGPGRVGVNGTEDVPGLWRWIDEPLGLDVIITIAADGDLFGQSSNGCTFDGWIAVNGSNPLEIEFDTAICGALDGRYSGFGSFEISGREDDFGRSVDTIRIQVSTLQRVITGRWERT